MAVPNPLEPSPDNIPNSASSGIELHARSSRLQAPEAEHGPSDHPSDRDIVLDPMLFDRTRLEQIIIHGNDVVEHTAANRHDIIEEVNLESGGDESLHSVRSVAHVDASSGAYVPSEPKPDNDTKRSSLRAGSIVGAAAAISSNGKGTNDSGIVPMTAPAQPHSASQPSGTAPTKGTAGLKRPSKAPFFRRPQNTGNFGDDYEAKYEPDPSGEEVGPNARVWKVYLDEAEAYDSEMTEQWRDTVDVLLVFAGLFSAVVTTFVAQTSQSLQADYTQTTASLLTELVALQRAAAQGLSPDSVPASPLNATTPFSPARSDRIINGFWFASLALSLSTALICILVKQWSQNYTSAISGTPKERALLRQMRFAGVNKWRVRDIVGVLPLLLHVSLLLFFIGLATFLFPLDVGICSATIFVAGLTYTAYAVSTFLAAICLDCPYRTPLSHYIYAPVALTRRIGRGLWRLAKWCYRYIGFVCHLNTKPLLYFGIFGMRDGISTLKGQDMWLIHDPAKVAHLTTTATQCLLETTTRPSAISIVRQSFAGFDQTTMAGMPVFGWDNEQWDIARDWASAVDDALAWVSHPETASERTLQLKVLHLERMSRALTKFCTRAAAPHTTFLFWAFIREVSGPPGQPSRVEQAITLLKNHPGSFDQHQLSSVCSALHALYIHSFLRSGHTESGDKLIETYHELFNKIYTGNGPHLWPFLRCVALNTDVISEGPPWHLNADRDIAVFYLLRPLQAFESCLSMLILLSETVSARSSVAIFTSDDTYHEPDMSAVTIMAVLYRMLYSPDSKFIRELGISYEAGAGSPLPERPIFLSRSYLLLLSIITGFTTRHPEWSSNKSARDALTLCLSWLCDIMLSYSQDSFSTDMLDTEHVNEYNLWGWEHSTTRAMWPKNIMPIVQTIIAHRSDNLSSANNPSGPQINFGYLIRSAEAVERIGYDYFKPPRTGTAMSRQGWVSSLRKMFTGS